MKVTYSALICLVVLLPLFPGCATKPEAQEPSAAIDTSRLQLYGALPEQVVSDSNPMTEAKIALGRMLFYETRISKGQDISCNSCHLLDKYGVDGEPTSDGHKGQKGTRNSPSVYNAAGHFVQFWDGRAADVEEQAKGPILNPVEMAMASDTQTVAVLKSMPEYVQAFKAAFPDEKDPVTYDNIAKAIGAFERRLVTYSPWDRYLRGEQHALTAEEKAGFNAFNEVGCQTCHAGTFVGGNLYQRLGAVHPWPDTSDPGRQSVTKNEADRMIFKVPSLRNIYKTGPYFHDGKVPTLESAVANMAEYQLGRKLTDAQVQSIVVWLKTLTGEIPADYIKAPKLPKSTGKTPKPDLG